MTLDPYAPKRRRVARIIKKWKTGTVTLTRGDDVYDLDAVVKGVPARYVDDMKNILATDLMAIVSPRARHVTVDGTEVDEEDVAVVDIVPRITDVIRVDGARMVIKNIPQAHAAGAAASFRIFMAS